MKGGEEDKEVQCSEAEEREDGTYGDGPFSFSSSSLSLKAATQMSGTAELHRAALLLAQVEMVKKKNLIFFTHLLSLNNNDSVSWMMMMKYPFFIC